jgi:hypothetical protein
MYDIDAYLLIYCEETDTSLKEKVENSVWDIIMPYIHTAIHIYYQKY